MKNMKYLLRLLGVVTLTGLSVTTLVACGDQKVEPVDLSEMKATNIPATKKNIIATTVGATTPSEISTGIMPSVLEGVKKFTNNKNVTKNDFTIGVGINAQGATFTTKDLSTPNATIFVQIRATETKVLKNTTTWLEYKLPKASLIIDLSASPALAITPIGKLYAETANAVKPQEILDNINQSIITAVQAKGNESITNDDIKIAISSDPGGTPLITAPKDCSNATTIYVQVSSGDKTLAVKNKTAWLEYALPPAEATTALSITNKALTNILSVTAAPSVENILLAINNLNTSVVGWKVLTTNDVTIAVNADNKGAKVTGKGQYHGSVDVTFTTLIVKTDLGKITPALPKVLVTEAEILAAINKTNTAATPGWTALTITNVGISNITTEGATVTCKGSGYQGVLSVTYEAKVLITDVTIRDPGGITVVSGATYDALNADPRITALIVKAINAANAIDVKTSDFTTTNNKSGVQGVGAVEFTVLANLTSKKITGTFKFIITLE